MADNRRAKLTKELLDKEFVSIEKKNQSLATAIFHTTKTNPFFGSVLQVMNIMYTHVIPTAGVAFNPEMKRWDLFINPHFFCTLLENVKDTAGKPNGDAARKAVLLHELYHIVNKHPMRVPFLKVSPRKRQIMNVAADMAINQYIHNLPNGCSECPPIETKQPCQNKSCPGRGINVKDYYDTKKDGKKIPWEERQTMEFYYEKLLTMLDDPENDDDDGQGDGEGSSGKGKPIPKTLDNHDWDAAGEEKDMIEATEDLVKRAMIKNNFSYDDIPGSVKELLDDLKARKAALDYRGEILAAIKKSASGHERKHTWSKKSRRFGNKAPGTKVGDLPKLHFYIDSSGSISVEEANEFLEIVDNFLRTGSRKCRLNIFHTRNYYSKDYKLGQRLKREDFESGGTCLEDSLRDVYTRKGDLNIFVTDGYYGDVQVEEWMKANDKFPQCLFIISRGGDKNHPLQRLGKTIKIPDARD